MNRDKLTLVIILSLLIFVSSLFLLSSCKTPVTPEPITITEIEYKPITLDIGDSVDAIFQTRPTLAPVFQIDETATASEQLLLCAILYKQWGEDWQDYAIRLEDYLMVLERTLKDPEAILE